MNEIGRKGLKDALNLWKFRVDKKRGYKWTSMDEQAYNQIKSILEEYFNEKAYDERIDEIVEHYRRLEQSLNKGEEEMVNPIIDGLTQTSGTGEEYTKQSPDKGVVDEELVDKILELATRWAEELFEKQKQTINLAHELRQLLQSKMVTREDVQNLMKELCPDNITAETLLNWISKHVSIEVKE